MPMCALHFSLARVNLSIETRPSLLRHLAFTRYCSTSKLYCGSQSPWHCPPPTCKAYPIAILLHDHCAMYVPPPTLLSYAMDHTILVMAISCKGQFATRRAHSSALAPIDVAPLAFTRYYFTRARINNIFANVTPFGHPTPRLHRPLDCAIYSPRPPCIAVYILQYWELQYPVKAKAPIPGMQV